jgi:hypothetical protein
MLKSISSFIASFWGRVSFRNYRLFYRVEGRRTGALRDEPAYRFFCGSRVQRMVEAGRVVRLFSDAGAGALAATRAAMQADADGGGGDGRFPRNDRPWSCAVSASVEGGAKDYAPKH